MSLKAAPGSGAKLEGFITGVWDIFHVRVFGIKLTRPGSSALSLLM